MPPDAEHRNTPSGAETYLSERLRSDPEYALAYWHARAHQLNPEVYGPLTFNPACGVCCG